jgi:DNA-binding beta-propeller fold protein YncE
VTLTLIHSIALPRHPSGGFDHGDVHLATGRVFVAHTAAGTVEVIDGTRGLHQGTIPGCADASGVLCAQEEGLVFAAARGAGRLMVLNAESGDVRGEVGVGPKPNGLAWDARRRHVLAADVQDLRARLVDPYACRVLADAPLSGRPRWCVYDRTEDRFLVNIREPACMAVLDAGTLEGRGHWPVSATGPHGVDLASDPGRAFIACDGGVVVALDLATGRELARTEIAGEPDVIWHNPERNLLYVAIGRPGLIDVIDTDVMARVQQVATEEGAHTAAFDRRRQRLYVFLPHTCRAVVYEEARVEAPAAQTAARQADANEVTGSG